MISYSRNSVGRIYTYSIERNHIESVISSVDRAEQVLVVFICSGEKLYFISAAAAAATGISVTQDDHNMCH